MKEKEKQSKFVCKDVFEIDIDNDDTKIRDALTQYCMNSIKKEKSMKPSQKTRDLSTDSDVASIFTLWEGEMYHVERIQVPYSVELSEMCQKAKSLRNRAIFLGRNIYFLTNRDSYPLASMYPDLAEKIYGFMEQYLKFRELEELKAKLFKNPSLKISEKLRKTLTNKFWYYNGLNNFLKHDPAYERVAEIHSQVPQQILWAVDYSWHSYFEAVKKWKVNPDLYPGGRRPSIPHYGRKYNEFPIIFPDQPFKQKRVLDHYSATTRSTIIKHKGKVKTYETGELIFPKKTIIAPVRTKVHPRDIIGVRIVPRGSTYIFEAIYRKKITPISDLKEDRAVAIDIGLNILMTTVNNFGKPPILIRGNKIKSDNQLMNKMLAKLQSARTGGKTLKKGQILPETMEMKRIRVNRNNKISDAFHKASRYLIDYCEQNQVNTIVIGYNKYWKSGINLQKKVTQNFVFVPFGRLITKIKYKAELKGIRMVVVNESYTSKCSALDYEPIKKHKNYLGTRGPIMKGKEKGGVGVKYYQARGLFKSSNGTLIHSDVNGAFNIGRKAFPEKFGEKNIPTEYMLTQPVEVNV